MKPGRPAAMALSAALALGGCAGSLVSSRQDASPQVQASFEAARARCGITVAETDAVKTCMSAQGWAYRHPWQ